MKNPFTFKFAEHNLFKLLLVCLLFTIGNPLLAQPTMENLDRGLVAMKTNSGVYLSWRLLGSEAYETGFNLYRDGTKITSTPITDRTNYVDNSGNINSSYYVTAVNDGTESEPSKTVGVWGNNIKRINLDVPAGDYSPNDCSVADLDGDGEYEIILKWDPSNSKDNASSGYTDKVFLDAYKLDGTKLWRIDLGKNVRAGAHYTQFMVYDLDLDGKAELVCRTAPGTKDGLGNFLQLGPAANDDDNADYRDSNGRVLSGPQHLTLFNGITGEEVSTVKYQPERGSVSSWGDNYGNRSDRYLGAVAYLDGTKPSVIMTRGYYDKTGIAAYDFDGTALTQRWIFWADDLTGQNPAYEGQGNHQLAVADVDKDGKQEILFGSMAVDHDGSPLYNTKLGHGDAYHVSDLDPDIDGLEVFAVHEDSHVPYGMSFRNAATGEVYWGFDADGDIGRGVSADIDPNYKGYESWSSMANGVFDCKGNKISDNLPQSTGGGNSYNHIVWWDGDLLSEILDRGVINKFNYNTGGTDRLWSIYNEGISTNNYSKANPCLTADIYGDWREEIIMRSSTNDQLVIFNTTDESAHKIYTLMSDPVYRCAIAWQNVSYNQPPHTGYYLGAGMETPTKPNILIAERGEAVERFVLMVTTDGYGSVSPSTGSYVKGDVEISAEPKAGWEFDHWSGDTTGNTSDITLALNEDKAITAHFTLSDPDGWNTFEAEDGNVSNGSIDSNNPGFSGTGFINTDNALDEWCEVIVFAGYEAPYQANIYFANGSSDDRATSVAVNGETQIESLSMPGSGDWTQWEVAETTLNLVKGENTIRLTALTAGGAPNIDRIEIIQSIANGVENTSKASDIKCYPSVVDNNFYVSISSLQNSGAEISVLNMHGQNIIQKNIPNQAQQHVISIDASALNAGIYLVKVKSGAEVYQQKIIKK